ncbi:TPA: response regulator, partial [Clostridioides difficile]|nr:response regulator [Clostridioides difficile]
MRLLIAEDEKGLNQVLVKRLEGEHYTVDACYDGEAALDYIRMTDYDAIILDIMMPKLDGMKVLKQLRGEGIKAPVLLLTARDGIQDR